MRQLRRSNPDDSPATITKEQIDDGLTVLNEALTEFENKTN